MSELKTRFIDDTYAEYYNTGKHVLAQIYLRSEADKVIAYNKYKLCLDMAGRCRLRGRLFGACGLYEKELWALKWHKRWLELAEKFKEAK